MTKPLIIYHADCTDGLTSAWVAARAIGDVELHPGYYGADPPDVSGRDVYMLDFSYKRPVMERLIQALGSGSLVVLDHHKTAQADLANLPHVERVTVIFDMERSGAAIAWDCFHGLVVSRPPLVEYVQDRDLWRWKLPNSRLVSAAIEAYPRTLEAWDELEAKPIADLVAEGSIIERYRHRCIEAAVSLARVFSIGRMLVPTANSSEMRFASDTAHELAEGQPFGATYWVRADGIVQFSLRSREGGADVSEIAKQYGGGGHKHAAGFQVSAEKFDGMLRLSGGRD